MATPRLIVTDFDGTVARLVIDWDAVREAAGVRRIGELWARGSAEGWHPVRDAEVRAAATAEPIIEVFELLTRSEAFAVITNNSSVCVEAFLDRFEVLRRRCTLVTGRELLGGPKEDEHRFAAAFAASRRALGADESEPLVYLGDQDYELVAAARCGASPLRVTAAGRLDGAGVAGVTGGGPP